MNSPSSVWRWLVIACLWSCPVLLHGEESVEDLRVRAWHGDAEAQMDLGLIFQYGDEGVSKDLYEAIGLSRLVGSRGWALRGKGLLRAK